MDEFKLTFQFGSVSYSYDLYFLLALALAVAVIYLFSMQRFAQPIVDKAGNDFVTPLLPKYMTTPQEYSRALIFYTTSMIIFVVVLSFLGPRVVALGSTTVPDAPAALPLFIALVLVGVLPNVPWLQQLEMQLRRFAHERAFIPKAARVTADKLASADFDFSRFNSDAVLRSPSMRAVEPGDFAASRDTLEYSWARLSCLLYQLRRRQDTDQVLPFDGDVLEMVAKDFEDIVLRRKSLEDDVTFYRAEKAKNQYYSNDGLQRQIRAMLRRLYLLMGCAVRLQLSSDFIGEFGFVLKPDDRMTTSNRNVMTVGLAVMTGCVFVTIYAAIGIAWFASASGLWVPSGSFPQTAWSPFPWALSALLVHGAAIVVADWLRRRIRSGTGVNWQLNIAHYIYGALFSAVAGFIVNFVWSLIFIGPSLRVATFVLPTMLVPAVSGGFYIFHLDNVELGKRPRPFFEVAPQAIATAFAGFASSTAQYALVDATAPLDFVLLNIFVCTIVGASLAWYIPRAASSSRKQQSAASSA